MALMDSIKQKAEEKKRILLPEGTEERTVQAVAQIQSEGIADVTLLGKTDEILAIAKKFNVSLDGVTLVDPEKDKDFRIMSRRITKCARTRVTPEKAESMMKDTKSTRQ
jgi:phosphate acetyltransferase